MDITFCNLPDEMIVEIAHHLPTDEIIQLRQIISRLKRIVNKTVWPHTTFNLRYLIMGIKFSDYQILIEPRSKYYDIFTDSEYEQIYLNLNRYCTVTLRKIVITTTILNRLTVAREVIFELCQCGLLDFDSYQLFGLIPTISFVRTQGLMMDVIAMYPVKLMVPELYIDIYDDYWTKFNELDLSYCEGYAIRELKCLSNVTGLRLNANYDLTYHDFEQFGRIKKLSLDTCSIPTNSFRYLTSINEIILIDTDINSTELSYLTRVEKLHLTRCQIITSFGHLNNLKQVAIDNCNNITGGSLRLLPSSVDVCEIRFCRRINSNGLIHLSNVNEIYLAGDNFTCAGMTHLANVKTISLWRCNISDLGLARLTSVQKLRLAECPDVDGTAFKSLLHLEEIAISHCPSIICPSLRDLTGVKKISLYSCAHLTNGLKYLAGKDINFVLNGAITDRMLRHLGHAKKLCLQNCFQLTNTGLDYLKDAQILKLKYCNEITNEGLSYLTNVKELVIYECANITNDAQRYLSVNTNVIFLKEQT